MATKVEFKRVQTDAEVENIDIKDGQLIYTGTGKTYMDYGTERIPTGSGGGSGTVDTEMSDTSENAVQNKVIKEYVDSQTVPEEVIVSDTQPTSDDWKLWIDSDEVINSGSEVVDSLEGNETNKAPSVHAVNGIIESGSNENGNYIKYADGTMVQYGTKTSDVSLHAPYGSLYRSSPQSGLNNFPVPFINNNINIDVNCLGLYFSTIFTNNDNPIYNYKLPAIIFYGNTTETANITFMWRAIGRWK